jgi:arsenite methyltransferase
MGHRLGVKDRLLTSLAHQLARPEGMRGRFVGNRLNRGNLVTVSAAVEATEAGPGDTVADIGFGGGVGLKLLLDRVGPDGQVHGIELSDTMLRVAERRYRAARTRGLLTLQRGTLGGLPLPDRSLDGLVTVNTLYFVDDLDAAFAELARVLRPPVRGGPGRAVVGVGDPTAMASMPFTRHGFRLRPVEDLVRGLQDAGLTVVRHGRVGDGEGAFHLLVASPGTSRAGD